MWGASRLRPRRYNIPPPSPPIPLPRPPEWKKNNSPTNPITYYYNVWAATPEALTIWMEFSVVGSGQMETKRTVPYHFIESFGCQRAGIWVRISKKHGGWTSRRVRRSSGRLGKWFFLETTISCFWLLQHPYLQGEIWIESLDYYFEQTIATQFWLNLKNIIVCRGQHGREPTKKFNYFSPAGLQLFSKTSANAANEKRHALHDKRFGNLLPCFRSLAFFLGKYYREEPGTSKCRQTLQKFLGTLVKARIKGELWPKKSTDETCQ